MARESGTKADQLQAEQDRAMAEIQKMFQERLDAGQFDDLTIREVKVKALQETETFLTNDAAASLMSVVVAVVVT